jgi:hypothetical protein
LVYGVSPSCTLRAAHRPKDPQRDGMLLDVVYTQDCGACGNRG